MAELEILLGKTVVIVAHPDDEAAGCGVLLQRMQDPIVVFATDGAPADSFFWGRYGSRDAYAQLRRDEARRALKLAGVTGGVTPWDLVVMRAVPQAVNAFLGEHAPPVLDPFCGGGSIPLEAQRLGLRALAYDLNPVPVLITKALVEIPPKFAGRPPVRPDTAGQPKKGLTDWSGARVR